MNKTVSIVMCTYNGAKYIREQLDSIIKQTYPITEIIIQDDCSSDETIQICEEYAKLYPIVKVRRNEKNIGVSLNFMLALEHAEGDFIAISDQDDIWELNKIETQVEALMASDALLSCSLSKAFTNDNILIDEEIRIPNCGLIRQTFFPVLPGHAMVFRREMLEFIPKELYGGSAYDLLLSLAGELFSKILIVPYVLNHHRRHINAHSYSAPNNYKRSLSNMFRSSFRAVHAFRMGSETRKQNFAHKHQVISDFKPNMNEKVRDALLFSKLMSEGSFLSLLRASCLCHKYRDELFYAKEKNALIAHIRSILFPILCSEYYYKP